MTWRPSSATRRGFLAALVAGGPAAAAASPADVLLDRAAPLSGRTWRTGRDTLPETVESPYGPATVTYDDYHVPHIEAETEEAAYYALGYVQAADRLFEMDLQRRLASGTLAAVVGASAVTQDEQFTRLDFQGAAAASARAVEETEAAGINTAFAEGITGYIRENDPGVEFGLLGYEPDEWTVTDTMLVGMNISWQISGSLAPLREDVKRATFDADTYRTLYPQRHEHDVPVLREGSDGRRRTDGTNTAGNRRRIDERVDAIGTTADRTGRSGASASDPAFVDWLEPVEPPEYGGSNAWLVAGEHTESGQPIVCSDPHLMLQAPPIWYEQSVTVGDRTVRGIAIPGTPYVVVGENDHGSWAMTAAQVSQTDLYSYEIDGDSYRYEGEWREFETEERTIEVAGGEDRTVTVKKTVHGPLLEREVDDESKHVAVSWVGHAETREALAFYRMARSEGVEEFRDALAVHDTPSLNYFYADRDGRTCFQTAGLWSISRVDGAVVPGDRVFVGSAGEEEWAGFEPFGEPAWDAGGFVPFVDLPGAVDLDYVASGNQRLVDDPPYPPGRGFAEGFRAERLYERLDETVGNGETVGLDFCAELQQDTVDGRARELVPAILDVRGQVEDDVASWLDELEGWDYRLVRDSTAALVFQRFYRKFREETWTDFFEERGLGPRYWPSERVLLGLPADSPFFDGDRPAVIARAATAAIREIEAESWEVYGDYNTAAIDHPFGQYVSGMNYPRHPVDGDWSTVNAFIERTDWGVSYRLLSEVGGTTRTVLPGGNDGSPLSEHYHDQLELWANGDYRTVEPPTGEPALTFEEEES